MRYTRLEAMVLGAGALMVTANILLLHAEKQAPEEIFAQVLLFVVLLGAVHWGRGGGFAAAAVASLLYLIVRIPLVMESRGLTLDIAVLVALRIAAFGVVGLVGGELFGRLKHALSWGAEMSGIDEWSQTYDEALIARILESLLHRFERYQTPFSVLVITLSRSLTDDLRASRHRVLVRGVATHLRSEIRLVDEIGRLRDGRFIILLPHTPREGAQVVSDRLNTCVSESLGVSAELLDFALLSAPPELGRIAALSSSLEGSRRQAASGR